MTTLKADQFEAPITVLGSVGVVQTIAGLCQALDFLDAWPVNANFETRIAAHLICLSAIDRELPAEAARQAFEAFADDAGILMAEQSFAEAA